MHSGRSKFVSVFLCETARAQRAGTRRKLVLFCRRGGLDRKPIGCTRTNHAQQRQGRGIEVTTSADEKRVRVKVGDVPRALKGNVKSRSRARDRTYRKVADKNISKYCKMFDRKSNQIHNFIANIFSSG